MKYTTNEIEAIATRMQTSEAWHDDDCRSICDAAGMLDQYDAADGETFESVVTAAADKLGVEIFASPAQNTTARTRKYHGIKAAVSAINTWPIHTGHTQIAYDPTDDRVMYEDNVGTTECTWADGIVSVGTYSSHITMAQLKQDIDAALADIDQ